ALLTLVCFQLELTLATTAFTYLILITLLSLRGSFIPLVALSIIAVGCLHYFFASPIFDFLILNPQDVVVVSAFLITSLVVTGLVRGARALQDQLRLVIDTIPTLAWSKLPDGSADFLNQRFRDYTGLSLEESRGWGWMNAFHPEDRAVDEWRTALAAGEPFEKEARRRETLRMEERASDRRSDSSAPANELPRAARGHYENGAPCSPMGRGARSHKARRDAGGRGEPVGAATERTR